MRSPNTFFDSVTKIYMQLTDLLLISDALKRLTVKSLFFLFIICIMKWKVNLLSGNDHEFIQSNPTSHPQNRKEKKDTHKN